MAWWAPWVTWMSLASVERPRSLCQRASSSRRRGEAERLEQAAAGDEVRGRERELREVRTVGGNHGRQIDARAPVDEVGPDPVAGDDLTRSDHLGAATLVRADEPLAPELVERGGHRAAAHREEPCEVALGREAGAVGQDAAHDGVAQRLRQAAGEGAVAVGGPVAQQAR